MEPWVCCCYQGHLPWLNEGWLSPCLSPCLSVCCSISWSVHPSVSWSVFAVNKIAHHVGKLDLMYSNSICANCLKVLTYLECLILASMAWALLQLLEPSNFQHRTPGVVASSEGCKLIKNLLSSHCNSLVLRYSAFSVVSITSQDQVFCE